MALPPETRRRQRRGPSRSAIKELLLLIIVDRAGPIGRYQLKDLLGLSDHEGTVRRMLVHLQKQGYLIASRSGCSLTPSGNAFLEARLTAIGIAAIKPVDLHPLTMAAVTLGVHLPNKAHQIESAMRLRDLAIRGGATGATILLFKDGALSIPSVHPDFLSAHPTLRKTLHDIFTLEENDVLAVISADDEWTGVEAALTLASVLTES